MANAQLKPSTLLMPKATAVWLIENTALSFRQIADFVALTEIEIEALANEDIGRGLVGRNPVENNEITQEELDRCEADPDARLVQKKNTLPQAKQRSKGPRYTPVSKRGDKPDAIAYILKTDPDITDAQICKLVGTTKPTIQRIRDRSHPNSSNLRPRHPADLGLCSYQDYDKILEKALKAAGKDPESIKAQREAERIAEQEAATAGNENQNTGGFDFSNFMPETSMEPASTTQAAEDLFKKTDEE